MQYVILFYRTKHKNRETFDTIHKDWLTETTVGGKYSENHCIYQNWMYVSKTLSMYIVHIHQYNVKNIPHLNLNKKKLLR